MEGPNDVRTPHFAIRLTEADRAGGGGDFGDRARLRSNGHNHYPGRPAAGVGGSEDANRIGMAGGSGLAHRWTGRDVSGDWCSRLAGDHNSQEDHSVTAKG